MRASGMVSNHVLRGRNFMDSPTFPTWLTDFVTEIKTKKGCEQWVYCGDYLEDAGLAYITGANGLLPRMQADCDGHRGEDNGVCDQTLGLEDWNNETAFQPLVESLGHGLVDLNPYVHPYVVLGNTGGAGDTNSYDPRADLIQPLSLVAVFCGNDTVRYGIWGDYGRPSRPWAGQASPAMESLCRDSEDAKLRTDEAAEDGVLIMAFNGREAVPGPMGANWDAKTPEEFSDSMHILGDTLLRRIYRRPRLSSASPSRARGTGRIFATLVVALPMVHSLSMLCLF